MVGVGRHRSKFSVKYDVYSSQEILKRIVDEIEKDISPGLPPKVRLVHRWLTVQFNVGHKVVTEKQKPHDGSHH